MNIQLLQDEKARTLRILNALDCLLDAYGQPVGQAPSVNITILDNDSHAPQQHVEQALAPRRAPGRGHSKTADGPSGPAGAPAKPKRSRPAGTVLDSIRDWIAARKGAEWTTKDIESVFRGRISHGGLGGTLCRMKVRGEIASVGFGRYKATDKLPTPTGTPSPKEREYREFRESLHIKPVPEIAFKSPEGRAADVQ